LFNFEKQIFSRANCSFCYISQEDNEINILFPGLI